MDYSMHIRLNDLVFYGHIGVFEQEQAVGAKYIVNLDCELPLTDKARADQLDGTVSYADLYEIVKSCMAQPRALLESACSDIIDVIRTRFPEIQHARISICKVSPPISGMQGSASIELAF